MKKNIIPIFTLIFLIVSALFVFKVSAFDGNDYGGGGGFGGLNSGDSSGPATIYDLIGTLFGVALFAAIFIGILISSKKKPKSKIMPNRTEEIAKIIINHDPDFSAEKFIEYAKLVYQDIQLAWCNRDLDFLRTILHENLYNTTANQIKEKISQGVVFHYEDINVRNAYLSSYTYDQKNEYLSLFVAVSMIDWQEDEKTGRLLRGSRKSRWQLQYKMKFMRPLNKSNDILTCSSCGAKIENASITKCEYCGSEIRANLNDWILCEFATLKNDTVDEGVKE